LSDAKTVPALFDGEQNESKRTVFETNKGVHNVYIKYSTGKKPIPYFEGGKKKVKYHCNVNFTDSEYDKLRGFANNGCINFIVIVWTNSSYTKTWLVVLEFDKAMHCLERKTETSRRISVTRFGAGREFYCQGVDFKDDEFEICAFDHIKYFAPTNN
jgi:hypothetical protein